MCVEHPQLLISSCLFVVQIQTGAHSTCPDWGVSTGAGLLYVTGYILCPEHFPLGIYCQVNATPVPETSRVEALRVPRRGSLDL